MSPQRGNAGRYLLTFALILPLAGCFGQPQRAEEDRQAKDAEQKARAEAEQKAIEWVNERRMPSHSALNFSIIRPAAVVSIMQSHSKTRGRIVWPGPAAVRYC